MRILLAFLAALTCLTTATSADQVGIFQGYDAFLWRYPDPPQDSSNLPHDPAAISYAVNYVQQDIGATPFDVTYAGTTPLGDGHANQYSMRLAGDSSFTQVKAALHAEFSDFSAANYSPGLYLNDNDDVVADTNLNLAHVTSLLHDFIHVSGVGGPIVMTMQFNIEGSVSAPGGFGSYSSGFPVAFGELVLGSYDFIADDNFRFTEEGDINQTVSLTTKILGDSDSYIQYGISLNSYLADYTILPPGFTLDGTLAFDFANTIDVAKIILTLPAGTDVSKVSYTFGSGANHNVEIRVANAVPEPSSIVLVTTAGLCCALPRIAKRRRGCSKCIQPSV